MLKIVFEFVGGPNDGKVLIGALGEPSDAERYYLFTNHGTEGQRFKIASDYAVETLAREHQNEAARHRFQPHYYVVTERLEEEGEVIVRAAYIERDAQPRIGPKSQSLVREHLEPTPQRGSSPEDQVRQCLPRIARSLADSGSHCWPAEAQPGQTAESNLILHFAHILLGEQFAVLSAAQHPDSKLGPIPLLGIAPSQDWFLTCIFKHLTELDELSGWSADVDALTSFWLSPRLANTICEPNVVRLAEHCETGLGLIGALHWSPLGSETRLLSWWRSKSPLPGPTDAADRVVPRSESSDENALLGRFATIQAEFSTPIAVRQFPGHGTFFLLSVFFRISRPA